MSGSSYSSSVLLLISDVYANSFIIRISDFFSFLYGHDPDIRNYCYIFGWVFYKFLILYVSGCEAPELRLSLVKMVSGIISATWKKLINR